MIEFQRFFMYPHKVHSNFMFPVLSEKPTPISQMMLLLDIHISSMLVYDIHKVINIELLSLLVEGLWGRLVRRLVELLGSRGSLASCLGGLLGVSVAPDLVTDLVVNVWVLFSDFLVIDKQSYLTLPVPQLIPLHFHLLPGPQCLFNSFVLYQNISPLGGQLIPLDFHVPDEAKATKNAIQILLISILRVISHRGIHHRDEVLIQFIGRIVADHIKPFKMVGKEYFKI